MDHSHIIAETISSSVDNLSSNIIRSTSSVKESVKSLKDVVEKYNQASDKSANAVIFWTKILALCAAVQAVAIIVSLFKN